MSDTSPDIEALAKARIAQVFRLPESGVLIDAVFGVDLKSTSRPLLGWNEYDILDADIKDVADKPTLRAFASGALVIRSVRDYCEHMARCFERQPGEVLRVLRSKVR